jgi:hypothetical protein
MAAYVLAVYFTNDHGCIEAADEVAQSQGRKNLQDIDHRSSMAKSGCQLHQLILAWMSTLNPNKALRRAGDRGIAPASLL